MAELYVPMDVNFDEHPAILACSIEAEAVYQRALRLSKRLMTDGLICAAHARRLTYDLGDGTAVFDELEREGLVRSKDGGWFIVGYLERNMSRDEIDQRREAEAARKRQWRRNRNATDGTEGQDDTATECPDGTESHATARDSRHRDSDLECEAIGRVRRMPTADSLSRDRFAGLATEYDWPQPFIAFEWAKFVEHSRANGREFTDIESAFGLWLSRSHGPEQRRTS